MRRIQERVDILVLCTFAAGIMAGIAIESFMVMISGG